MPTPEVTPNENLVRQVGTGGDPIFYDSDRCPVIHQKVFLPTPKDTDGLSLIRSIFRSDVWAAHRPEKPDVVFKLAKSTAEKLTSIAMECGFDAFPIEPSPDSLDNAHGEPWGHCVATQINISDYQNKNDKEAQKKIKQWAKKVSESLTRNDVVDCLKKPEELDSYRP